MLYTGFTSRGLVNCFFLFWIFEYLFLYFNISSRRRKTKWLVQSKPERRGQAGGVGSAINLDCDVWISMSGSPHLPTSPQLSTGLPGPLLPDISLCWLDRNILEIINRTEKSRITGREAVRDYLRSSQESFIRDCKTALTVSNQHCNPSSPPHHLQCNKKYWSSGAI